MLLNTCYEQAGDACRRNADLQVVSLADRSVLLATAMDSIICLSGTYISAQAQLTHHRGFMSFIDPMYGPSTAHYYRWATTFVNCDQTLFKLALALFALSTSS